MKQRSLSAFSLVEVTLALGDRRLLFGCSLWFDACWCTNKSQCHLSDSRYNDPDQRRVRHANNCETCDAGARISSLYDIIIPARGSTGGRKRGILMAKADALQTWRVQSDPTASSWAPPIQTRYQLNITFPLGATGLTYADIKVTWPAAAIPTMHTRGSVEMFAAFDRN